MSYTIVGSKTPVSILNEYFVAQKIVPRFDLVVQSIGHNPIFTYRVSAGDDFAEGSGSSKQQAKHASAQLLLDILRERDDQPQANLLNQAVNNASIPHDNLIGFNAVGDLTQYCADKNYPEAIYELVSDEGPPHARVFTFKCTVSNITELGPGRTKKQAKHQSAYAMWVRLKQLCNEEHNPIVKLNYDKPKAESKVSDKMDEAANENYLNLMGHTRRFKPTPAFIADHFRHYAKLMEKSKTLAEVSENKKLLENPSTLDIIAEELGEPLIITTEFGKEETIVFVCLNIKPKLVNVGFTVDEAKLKTLCCLCSML